jgi:hypothetical protein
MWLVCSIFTESRHCLSSAGYFFELIKPLHSDGGYLDDRAVSAISTLVRITEKKLGKISIAILPCRWAVKRFATSIGCVQPFAENFEFKVNSNPTLHYTAF